MRSFQKLPYGAPCAVAIVPRGYAENVEELTSIVVGFDGSDEAQMALDDAVELARAAEVPVKLVAVAAPPQDGRYQPHAHLVVLHVEHPHVRPQSAGSNAPIEHAGMRVLQCVGASRSHIG